jgi:hypothetical protein
LIFLNNLKEAFSTNLFKFTFFHKNELFNNTLFGFNQYYSHSKPRYKLLINFDSFGKFFNLLNLTLEPIDAKESIFQAYRDFFRTTTTQKTKQPLATQKIVPSPAQTKPTKMLTTPSKQTTSTKVLTTPTKPTTLTKKTTLFSPTSTKVTTINALEKGALLQLGAKNSTKKGYTSKSTRRPTTIFQVPCDCAPCDCAPCDCVPCDCVPCDCLFWQNYPPMPIRT